MLVVQNLMQCHYTHASAQYNTHVNRNHNLVSSFHSFTAFAGCYYTNNRTHISKKKKKAAEKETDLLSVTMAQETQTPKHAQ
jgi:hypothetical protein